MSWQAGSRASLLAGFLPVMVASGKGTSLRPLGDLCLLTWLAYVCGPCGLPQLPVCPQDGLVLNKSPAPQEEASWDWPDDRKDLPWGAQFELPLMLLEEDRYPVLPSRDPASLCPRARLWSVVGGLGAGPGSWPRRHLSWSVSISLPCRVRTSERVLGGAHLGWGVWCRFDTHFLVNISLLVLPPMLLSSPLSTRCFGIF